MPLALFPPDDPLIDVRCASNCVGSTCKSEGDTAGFEVALGVLGELAGVEDVAPASPEKEAFKKLLCRFGVEGCPDAGMDVGANDVGVIESVCKRGFICIIGGRFSFLTEADLVGNEFNNEEGMSVWLALDSAPCGDMEKSNETDGMYCMRPCEYA